VSGLVELIAFAKQSGDYGAVFAAIPYARFLGITGEVRGSELVGKLTFSPTLIGNPVLPALHGGTIGALLESTAIFQLFWEAETVILPKTINVTIAYLRSGRPVDTFARAVVTKQGRRVASVRAEAWQEDPSRSIATAVAHFLVTPAEAGS
jgi:acyl-coenzyme A thioesterase PaaI-like protein